MVSTRRTPTIQDVARQANVSAATVSRVLSNPEKVSEATRERVNLAVRETGYTINQTARSLRMRAAKMILIALPDIGNPFYSTILDAVVDEADGRGYGVIVASRFGTNPSRLLNEYFLSSRADGMLLFDGGVDVSTMHALDRPNSQPPLVVSFDEMPPPGVASVMVDNLLASERATEYLIGLGHREIGHIIGPTRNAQPNLRLVGYRNAMARAGLEVRPEWLFEGDYAVTGGTAAAEALLKQKQRPTAIFSANDEMALGFLSAMRSGGVECPRDISLIGFDDISVAPYFSPRLTTMRQQREQIGRIATETLIDILEGTASKVSPRRVVLRSERIERESARKL